LAGILSLAMAFAALVALVLDVVLELTDLQREKIEIY
jgi:hypothetical protein